MLIDSHVHIGDKEWCKNIIETSKYKDLYKIYACINPEYISNTNEFLADVSAYFAIPLFFCESNIEETNKRLLESIKDDKRAIPILLVCNNENKMELFEQLQYNILKEHFTLHNPDTYKDRSDIYNYLSQNNGYLLLHTFSSKTLEYVLMLRKEFPNMNIIVAHLGRDSIGSYEFTSKMIDSISNDDKIFTDISTISNPELIKYAVQKFGKDRVLYGSDFPFEVNKIMKESDFMHPAQMANLKADEYENLFYNNSNEIIKKAKILIK